MLLRNRRRDQKMAIDNTRVKGSFRRIDDGDNMLLDYLDRLTKGKEGETEMKATDSDQERPSYWQLVFLQSKVNGLTPAKSFRAAIRIGRKILICSAACDVVNFCILWRTRNCINVPLPALLPSLQLSRELQPPLRKLARVSTRLANCLIVGTLYGRHV